MNDELGGICIKIFWNGLETKVRKGTKIESLLSENELEDCRAGKAIIIDDFGFEYGLDGYLNEGIKLKIKAV